MEIKMSSIIFPVSNSALKQTIRTHAHDVKCIQPEAVQFLKHIMAEFVCRLVHKTIEDVENRGRNTIYLDDVAGTLAAQQIYCTQNSMSKEYAHTITTRPKVERKSRHHIMMDDTDTASVETAQTAGTARTELSSIPEDTLAFTPEPQPEVEIEPQPEVRGMARRSMRKRRLDS